MQIREAVVQLYSEFLSKSGTSVDYCGMKLSRKFQQYIILAEFLQRIDIVSLSIKEKISFFINIYNAFVIHAFVVNGAPGNLFKRFRFYNTYTYLIGGLYYSLHDIESGILRSNRKPPFALKNPFSTGDPRLKFIVPIPDTRIHFALNCGARSCPPIKIYSHENLDEELKIATEAFLEGDGVEVDILKREICLSKIFHWYKNDFGGSNDSIIKWIISHMSPGNKCSQLKDLLNSQMFKISYQSYNWDLNTA